MVGIYTDTYEGCMSMRVRSGGEDVRWIQSVFGICRKKWEERDVISAKLASGKRKKAMRMIGFAIYSMSATDGACLDDGHVDVGGRAMRFEFEGEPKE